MLALGGSEVVPQNEGKVASVRVTPFLFHPCNLERSLTSACKLDTCLSKGGTKAPRMRGHRHR